MYRGINWNNISPFAWMGGKKH